MKTAIVTGVGGQDGRYLSEQLVEEGFHVVGVIRRSSQPRDYLLSLKERGVELVEGDITDYSSIQKIVQKYQPDHFYGLAAQSHVGTSFHEPLHTWDATGKAVLNILEVIRNTSPQTRFYNAASSEMFGSMYSMEREYDQYAVVEHFNVRDTSFIDLWGDNYCGGREYARERVKKELNQGYEFPQPFQNEATPMRPASPYGIAKLAGYHATRLYRESYGLFTCSGILFNHESELRSLTFVTRKITNYVSRLNLAIVKNKKIDKLKLGNLDAKRDWSHASDMTRAMYMMLCQDKPDDYVVGSGDTYTVRDFASRAFSLIGEKWEDHIEIDPEFIRPSEVDYLRADPTKAKTVLGWKPLISFDELVERMVKNDIKRTNIKHSVYGDI